ncbi:hypothetical protein [Pseudoalteromonas denitrificans]|jgi:hypothetical protein|uniref:Uncharacterized protein n=1 Tax=Pseudoalteromonas denitrificans DSM 6059 TaxID=1123010 RepID=A0A1I1SGB8_9GAMM|nr:hypothetical protein [Pseudoalteromonas denitrificans]SFD43678.1 hypothetical protein SAMN02745724_04523 [Pseudoalteromonas denitrificans DSM 6059]
MKTFIYSIFYLSLITALGYLAFSNTTSNTWLSGLFLNDSSEKTTQKMLVDISHSIESQFKKLQEKNKVQSQTITLLEQQMHTLKKQMQDMTVSAETKINMLEGKIANKEALGKSKKTTENKVTNLENNDLSTQQESIQVLAERKMSLREIADKMNMRALSSLSGS